MHPDNHSAAERLRREPPGWSKDRWPWRERIRRNPLAYFWYRLGIGVVGLLMMVGAALTGWLPGPGGIPLFMLGLLVWSSEFTWAHNVMLWFKHAFEWFQAKPGHHRWAFYAACILCALGAWYGLALWQGLPDWLPDRLVVLLAHLPGLER